MDAMRCALKTVFFLCLSGVAWAQLSAPRQAGPNSASPANGRLSQPPQAAAQPNPKPAPERLPNPPENVLFRPFFLTPDIAHYAGLAFRLRHEGSGQHFFVTCHSLFSPTYGLDVQMTPADIAKVIVAAIGVSCTDRTKIILAQPYVPVPDAHPADEKGNSDRDIALFRIAAREGEPALLLDPAPSIAGDRVWIFVKYAGTPRLGLEPATIRGVTAKEILYVFDNKNADLKGTAGAPVLDIDGRVVGIHLGTFVSQAGKLVGNACPAAAIALFIEPPRKVKSLK